MTNAGHNLGSALLENDLLAVVNMWGVNEFDIGVLFVYFEYTPLFDSRTCK